MRIQLTKTIEKTWHFNGNYEEFIAKLGLVDTPETRERWEDLIEDEYIDRDFFGDAIDRYLDECGSDSDISVHVFKEVRE